MELKEIPICRRCGRKLRTPEARALGIGPICLEKSKQENKYKPLFSIYARKENKNEL